MVCSQYDFPFSDRVVSSNAYPWYCSYVAGREFAGKSTLCKNFCEFQEKDSWGKRFMNVILNTRISIDKDKRTFGVEIHRTRHDYWGQKDTQIVFLDFGGHSIYHASQEFFLVERNSMAIVVLSPLRAVVEGDSLFHLIV